MGRLWRPLLVGAVVVVAVFLLAQWPIFEPEASTNETLPRGAVLYEAECSSCHGPDGEGGIGPELAGSGLDAAEIAAKIEEGGGGMPADLVAGDDVGEVAAYVASIANP